METVLPPAPLPDRCDMGWFYRRPPKALREGVSRSSTVSSPSAAVRLAPPSTLSPTPARGLVLIHLDAVGGGHSPRPFATVDTPAFSMEGFGIWVCRVGKGLSVFSIRHGVFHPPSQGRSRFGRAAPLDPFPRPRPRRACPWGAGCRERKESCLVLKGRGT